MEDTEESIPMGNMSEIEKRLFNIRMKINQGNQSNL